ncbi:TetR/AcrR family transcriptional regulator [Novosphingobium sp. JCM 18896]|uniref:TetR/AcrR family transcriptional regulator n=1 Tax=Novosphingobium sp. JCM 18896 TaxID=2989731 RepID=UPI0022232972|nr:TetR/AcrR family transcriptional regulator [Novosphingobium sp. JCM 18896]MCW1431687.1 TetR/AcrR family transcriptional regulator [Novosphingobium sp. JCM 18896]
MILQFRNSHMNRRLPALLQPRKSPRQARSAATIEAIHTATIQVLLADGVGKLTTTRVAERAGVSVGTMYQYYPHKQALLFAIVERQLETIMDTMMAATERLQGADLAILAEGLATAWLDAKTADIVSSRAIYAIAAEFDLGEHMALAMSRMIEVICGLIATAPDTNLADAESAAFMVAVLLGGSVRVVMEAGAAEGDLARLRRELPRACAAYLAAAN